jgi:hypothetical protein
MKNQLVSLTKVKSFKIKLIQKVKINIFHCLKNLILAFLMKKNLLSKSKLRYRFPFWMKYSLVNQKKSKHSSKSLCKLFRSKIKIKSQIKCQIYQTFKNKCNLVLWIQRKFNHKTICFIRIKVLNKYHLQTLQHLYFCLNLKWKSLKLKHQKKENLRARKIINL